MTRLVLSFLDTFQVTLDRQPLTHFRSANNQGILAFLVLQSGKSIARETLTAVFWPEETDKNARNNLRQALHTLRRLLGELEEPEQPFLLVTRQTIQFNPHSDYILDVQQFLEAAQKAELVTAVSLYHGDLLPGFTCDSLEFEDWLRQERESLHHLALDCMDRLTREWLQNGRPDKAQITARQQLALEPWREEAHRQLMQAFALAGDRGSALAQFEICRERLGNELGLEPSPATLTLYEEIKAGKLAPIDPQPADPKPLNQSPNLPLNTTPFIGRKAELTALSAYLSDPEVRLVTILGPGGMGKTRLALALAEQEFTLGHFSQGVYFVDLTPFNEPQQIISAVVETLGIHLGGGQPEATPRQLLSYLADKNMLFVLDNFEHLLAGAKLVSAVITAAPNVSIITTSRERLHLQQEQLFPITGLEFPELDSGLQFAGQQDLAQFTAVQLFLGAAQRVRPDFQIVPEDLACLTHICQLVGGMPLALELAAGWVELLPLSEIASEIERCLSFLETDLQDIPDRQRSIYAIFGSTWDRLETAEQDMIQKLSVFRGGFDRQAANQVAAEQLGSAASLRLLARLVNKSLLQANATRERYQIHELLRQYAGERLDKSGTPDSIRSMHARYYLNLLQRREGDMKGGRQQKEALNEIEADFGNIRAAWNWALNHGDLGAIDRSLEALFWFFWFHSRQLDGMTFFEKTLKLLPEAPGQNFDLLKRRLALRRLYLDRGAYVIEPAQKLREVEQFLPLLEKEGPKEELAFAYHVLGHAQIDYQGDYGLKYKFSDIIDIFTKSLNIYRQLNEPFYETQVLDWLSVVYFASGNSEERVRVARQRLAMAEEAGDQLSIADSLSQIGVWAELNGSYNDALEKYEQALLVFKQYGDKWHHMEYLLRLAGLAFLRGDIEKSRSLVAEVQAAINRYNLVTVPPHVIEHVAILRCLEEDYQGAVDIAIRPRLHFYPPTIFALDRCLMYGYCGLGDFQTAEKHLRLALETADPLKAKGFQVQCLPGAALIVAANGQLARAAELLSLAFHHPAGATGWLEIFPLIVQLRSRLQAELDPDIFNAAWERGKKLDLETVVAPFKPPTHP